MKVLVTGDRGYIGSVLVPLLLEAGHEVTGLDAGWFDGCDFGRAPSEYEQRTGDIRHAAADNLQGFEAVVHLAAVSNDPIGSLNPDATLSVNARGAIHMAKEAKEAGASRFVFASSCSLYGAGGDGLLDEESSFHPVTPYGVSKVQAEEGLSALADDDFSPTYLRNATAYGSSPRLRADIVVNNLTATAVSQGAVRLQSDGRAWRPLVHVRDISGAVLAALGAERRRVHDRAFNIGRDEDVLEIRQVAEAVSERANAPVTFADGAGADGRNYRVDFRRVSSELPEFVPAWRVADGIDELYKDMQRLQFGRDAYEGPRFTRLAKVQELLSAGVLDDQLTSTRS